MKKIVKKKLCFTSICRLEPAFRVKLCILLLTFSVATVSAASFNSGEPGTVSIKPETDNYTIVQQNIVRGTVKDAATGEALAGVGIMVKGTTVGTLTDVNGQFSLGIPGREAILIISFIGYTPQEINVTAGTSVNVSLVIEFTQMGEVVVVGYGTQKKESMVGAITQVNNATLVRSAATNVTNAISGKLSGVLTIHQSGEPGNDQAEIIVRGLSSWQGSAPLVLVDGVERDFRDMDPNEISSISVLKDASATAVFGSKGANGVIIVTTKRGVLSKPAMTFSGSTGAQVPTRLPSYIDSYTTMSMLNVARMNDQQFTQLTSKYALDEYKHPSSRLKALQYPSINWFDECTRDFAPTVNGNLNVTGGTDFVKYFITLGYLYQGNLFKQEDFEGGDFGYWYHRYNYRANLDFNLTKTTQLSFNLGGDVGIRNTTDVSYYGYWMSFYGTTGTQFPAYWPDWVLDEIPDIDYPDASGRRLSTSSNSAWFMNPYNSLNRGSFQRTLVSKVFMDLILDQKLDGILKGLSVKGKISTNSYYSHRVLQSGYNRPTWRIIWDYVGVDANGDGKVDNNPWFRDGQSSEYYYPEPYSQSVGGLALPTGGTGDTAPTLSDSFTNDLYWELSLNYSNTFGKHTVNALALMNRQQRNLGTQFPYYNAAFVGRITYDYSRRYLMEVNIGYTGSERFAPSNRYGFFPSGAIGWVISEENFFKNAVPWMNKLKIRYSDGQVGSDYASSRWLYTSDYYVDNRGYLWESASANSSAQWEVARKKDLGIEIGIFKNLFSFSVDLFDEQRSKMLLTPQTTTFLIGNSFKDLNLGKVKKHGIEVEVEFNKMTAAKLNYWIKGNLGLNENRILFRDDPAFTPEYLKDAGKPINVKYGELTADNGYLTSVDDIHMTPSPISLQTLVLGDYKFIDYNVDGVINTQDRYPVKGLTYAPVVYAVSGGLSWKGFDLSLMFQGNQGKYQSFAPQSELTFYKGDFRVHSANLDYWTPDNPDPKAITPHFNASDVGPAIISWISPAFVDHYWRNSNYLRLKEIYLGYNLNSAFLKRVANISNLLIYANGTDVFTFSPLLREYDPEVKSFGAGWYPLLNNFNLGVKFSF